MVYSIYKNGDLGHGLYWFIIFFTHMILDAPNIVALTPQPWHHLARIVPTPPWPAVAPEASRCAAWRKRRHRGTTQRPIAHLHLRSTWNRLNWMKLDKIGTLGHCTYKNLHFTQKNVDFKKRTKKCNFAG
jgi:hypothetical protein